MIELTENQIAILGKPNFACASIAKLLIYSGIYEDKAKKAEYEQAGEILKGLIDNDGRLLK